MSWSNPPLVTTKLAKRFKNQLHKHYPELTQEEVEQALEITPAKQLSHGHYQCNCALKLSKKLSKNPREIAQKLQPPSCDLIEKTEVAGPGFINIFIKPSFLEKWLNNHVKDPRLGISRIENPKKIIVEFSSPNTAKELHVGHLRSTIIGDCLARLFEFIGHDVLRLNHVGDWGTPFGMLICFLQENHPEVLNGNEPADLSDLARWYKESRRHFDEDPEFKKRSQEEVVRLQSKLPSSIKAWEKICEISRQGYQAIYDLLDVEILERGESYYHDQLPNIVKYFESKDLVTVSDGAKCLFLPGFVSKEGSPLPTIIQKSDGGYNYATTDLAALYQRTHEEKADRILHVVDNGQSLHFQMVFKAAEIADYFEHQNTEALHIPFGLVLGADGTKFKTRSGDTEKLIDLLLMAVKKAKMILADRSEHIPSEEMEKTAKALGINAVKYADLSSLRTKDYQFSYDKMLQFEGNTAAFLMYSYVRIKSIQNKAKQNTDFSPITLEEPAEVHLALHLIQLQEVLSSFSEALFPNRLCEYLYQLANLFNAFFRDCPVIGSDKEASRLSLLHFVKRSFELGFSILGFKTVNRM